MASDSVRKIATGQWDDYTAGCFLEYNYFKNYYKMIAIELNKQQAIDADLKTIQQIDFTENWAEGGKIFFIIEEAKKTILDFSQGTVKVLWMSSYHIARVAKAFDWPCVLQFILIKYNINIKWFNITL